MDNYRNIAALLHLYIRDRIPYAHLLLALEYLPLPEKIYFDGLIISSGDKKAIQAKQSMASSNLII